MEYVACEIRLLIKKVYHSSFLTNLCYISKFPNQAEYHRAVYKRLLDIKGSCVTHYYVCFYKLQHLCISATPDGTVFRSNCTDNHR